MGILGRTILLEVASSAALGAILFIFVLFLQKAGQLFSILVSSAATPGTVLYLFFLLLPATMPLTLPLGVLVGVLIALSRMSSDGEVLALRAAGIPSRSVAVPVLVFASIAMAVTAGASLWLTPWCNQEVIRVLNRLGAAQLTAEIQPRIFEETFPNTVLYVDDVIPGQPARWRGVFLADVTPAEQRKGTAGNEVKGQRITLASEALVVPDRGQNRLQMTLRDGHTYEAGPNPNDYYTTNFPTGDQVLDSRAPELRKAKLYTATPTLDLWKERAGSVEARLELHQRLALPLAAILLALTGIPLGVSARKGGKSAAFVITVVFAFVYYMAMVSLIGLSREGKVSPEMAVWTPNLIFAIAGLILMLRLELPGDRDIIDKARSWIVALWERARGIAGKAYEPSAASQWRGSTRLFLLPQVIDTYVLSTFLFYFAVLSLSFVLLTELFNFFELLGDVFRNQIPISELVQYLAFLAPKLIYDAAPLGVLVAVLVTFGVMAKNNELIALKACGVSVYRLAMSVLVACLVLSGALFVFDHYVVTSANLVQDNLRNKIKGRPVQTYLDPSRKWIRSDGGRVFFQKYFNQEEGLMGEVNVYEIDKSGYKLHRQIYAERARWEPRLKTWVFQNGWMRQFGQKADEFQVFENATATFPEITEPPSYFLKEVKTYKQMTYLQLWDYILELQKGGFNTVPLQVQFYRKFSVPLFVFVMALLSVPFAFLTGGRGAMTGVGVSLGIAIAYFALNQLFEQLGGVNLLPPEVAAWAPDVLFALAGVYLMTRMRT